MSDDSDSSEHNGTKRKTARLDDSTSSDSSIEIITSRKKRKVKNYIGDSDSSSDSSVEIVQRKKRVRRVLSDAEDSSSSDSEIVTTRKSATTLLSDSDSSEYDSDWISEPETPDIKQTDGRLQSPKNNGAASDTSDGNSEKCPICLLPFKSQQVGSPESCDHSFCVDCIVEWSKNVNTCPVDRQTFNLILVRDDYQGKVIKQIPVEPATQQNEVDAIVEDATFCEVCGRSDHEDRMLLCDGCDMGFHLECLNPPLQDVPAGVWFCRECGPELDIDDPMIDIFEVQLLMEDAETLGWPTTSRRRNRATPRLVPRTRHSERVRARIITRRSRRLDEQQDEAPGVDNINEPGPSSSNTRNSLPTRQTTTRKKKYRKRRRKPKIKITYELDEATGETIAIETKIRRKGRKKRRRKTQRDRARRAAQPKTVKKRLAMQLGICPPRQVTQTIPDVRVHNNPDTINFRRSQLGIPQLHIFGRRDELDYFSGADSDGELTGGVNVLIRRRPQMSDGALLRRAVRRKAIVANPTMTPSNILDDILDSQSKLHSKNSVMSLDKDGTVKVDSNRRVDRSVERDLLTDRNRVNLNGFNSGFRQAPMYGNGNRTNANPSFVNSNMYSRRNSSENLNAVTTSSAVGGSINGSPDEGESEQSFSVHAACSSYDLDTVNKKDKEKEKSQSGTPGTHNSDSELDIYSDIETVSTSRAEESDIKIASPALITTPNTLTDEDANSDVDLIIDTEKVDDKFDDSKEQVSSTVDLAAPPLVIEPPCLETPHSTSDIQNQTVQSSVCRMEKEDDEDSEDGCPNFSIYSSESINLAKTTDLQLLNAPLNLEPNDRNMVGSLKRADNVKDKKNTHAHGGLYSDSEDDTLIKIDHKIFDAPNENKTFGLGDISNMTEDISEEERSYTPCLDERSSKQGLEGLDTELISDEDRNDFDESHELKTASDGDALEINAKESELDFSKPEDYEEGEIVDKLKAKKAEESKKINDENTVKKDDKPSKENETLSFKKLSKNNKERNYRDKDKEKERDRSKSKEKKSDKENRKERKKEKRKEIERYNVRSIIAEKPRRMKDKFGRDEVRKRSVSRSRSSRSRSGARSCSRNRSPSRDRVKKFRGRSRTRRSPSRSKSPERRRSKSPERRRSKSKVKRSLSRDKRKSRRKSVNEKLKRKESRHKSPSPRRRRDWTRRQSRGWSRSSHSYTPEQRLTPSWTPPRVMPQPQSVKPHNLTVILNNDINKKKKDKKKKVEKKKDVDKSKKRRREKTPQPSKEVFASGNNILVSVSFNKDTNERDVTKRKRTSVDEITTKRTRKEKEKNKTDERRKNKNKDLAGIKPVAIIDLERSPFREITPSPLDIIVLTDSDNGESNDMLGLQKVMCDSSQQVASPERSVNANYLTGPKTPPEPQVKFSLNPQQPKLRAISNPLHEPDDVEVEIDPQEELEQRLNETLHKGPNTPPEPPISPPSSPDAYDPFDPTKSRSPTPQPLPQTVQSSTIQSDIIRDEVSDSRNDDDTSEINAKSHTPPVVPDIQPADSQSNIKATTPEKSPEHTIGVIINQVVQSQAQAMVSAKPSYSTNTIITSTPINLAPRINILNSTILTPSTVASALPQRIVLPTTTKSSPVKVSPNKLPIKSTPIKPMPVKNLTKSKTRKSNQNGNEEVTLDFESPYSPGSSDYEDLFEPPTDTGKLNKPAPQSKATKSPAKTQTTFDVLFGSSPVNNLFKNKKQTKTNANKYKKNPKGTKQVGVKIDEDTLKILDELPNSAVEMQVKDKYLKKLNRQERVVEEVKLVLKPHYNKKHINKEEYKDILRRSVPKICHNKSGEINPKKIQNLIEAYVKKIRHSKKVTSSSSINNTQKV